MRTRFVYPEGKSKALMYDVTKIVSALKGKRGDHRVFRLAENLCMNLILSLRDFFFVKREGKVVLLSLSFNHLFLFIYLSSEIIEVNVFSTF